MTVRGVWMAGAELDVSGAGYAPEGGVHARRGASTPRGLRSSRARGRCATTPSLERDDERWHIVGDPTEGALLTLARKLGLDPDAEQHRHPARGEVPFDSGRKRMTTVHAVRTGSPRT